MKTGAALGTAARLKHCSRNLLLAVATGLTACATPPTDVASLRVLSGRMSVQVPAYGAESARGFAGQFELRGSADAGTLEVSGPLGVGSAQARWAAGRYRLQTGQQILEFASLDELTQAGLGEPLPIAALFDWLKARPWSGAPSVSLGEGLLGFEQLGWRIDTGELAGGRLRAQRLQPPTITLRILLDQPTGP